MRSPSVPVRIDLASGISISRPFDRLLNFCTNEYDTYDAVPIPQDNTIGVFEIVLTTSVNAGLTANTVAEIYRSRRVIEQALSQIAPNASLLDPDWPRQAVVDLLDAACSIRGVWLAVATKVLHKKRPGLLPMLDSVVLGHYFGQYRKRYERWPATGEVGATAMDRFRTDLVSVAPQINSLVNALRRNHGYSLTPTRALEILVWMRLQTRWYQDAWDEDQPRRVV